MLTNNFYIMQAAVVTSKRITGKAVTPEGESADIDGTSGSYRTIPFPTYASFIKNYDNYGICVGSGNTPAAKTDYKLESLISSGLTEQGYTNATNFLDNGFENIHAIILMNDSNESITISEIGLMATGYKLASSNMIDYFLVDRTVLDTPVTIPAGETKTISYSIRINYPA